jgi:two-component system nitrate/nitrite response regulator NarL
MLDDVSRTVVIVDDHSAFRDVARELLADAGFDVAGEARDGAEALEEVAELHPDVVLLDIQLPDLDGFEVARRIAELPSPPEVVLVSSRGRSAYPNRFASCPVRGFIAKQDLSAESLLALLSE